MAGKTISTAVMAHPARKEWAKDLAKTLGCEISWDRGAGVWRNRVAAMRMYRRGSSHHLVLQDDAILCSNFLDRARRIILDIHDAKPGAIVSLYRGHRRNMLVDCTAPKLEVHRWLFWGVAVSIPTDMIEEMLRYCEDAPGGEKDDTRLANFCRHHKTEVIYPLPCLVDHRSGKSLVGDPAESRRAVWFVR